MTILISNTYAKQLQELHRRKKIGFGVEPPERLKNLLRESKVKNIVDYGCGDGAMMEKIKEYFPNLVLLGYDPGVEQFSTLPDNADLLYSVDVLEHFEPSYIDIGIEKLLTIADFHYHNIACHPAKKFLPDGRNCHLIIESPSWWLEKIGKIIDKNWTIVYQGSYESFHKKRKGTHFEIILMKATYE